jgi:hypothetical protein
MRRDNVGGVGRGDEGGWVCVGKEHERTTGEKQEEKRGGSPIPAYK